MELDAACNNYLVSRAMTVGGGCLNSTSHALQFLPNSQVNYKQGAFHLKLSSAILHLHGQDELVDADGVVDFADLTRE